MTGEHYADTVSHRPAVVKPLKFTCHIKELVACLDCEQVDSAVNQAAARIITESIDLFFSKNSEESTGRIAISSIQIDNVTGDSTGYRVVFTPRKRTHSFSSFGKDRYATVLIDYLPKGYLTCYGSVRNLTSLQA